MTTERDEAKSKIMKLSRMAFNDGASESEANFAMQRMGELLEAFDLTLDECAIREQQYQEIKIQTKGYAKRPIDGCVVNIAKFCDCLVFFTRSEKGLTYNFFGAEQDVAMVEYLYGVIDKTIEAEVRNFKRSEYYRNSKKRRSASNSFEKAMAWRISARLNELKKDLDKDLQKKRDDLFGKSLDTSLILVKDAKLHDEFKKKYGWSVRSSRRGGANITDYGAYSSGNSAGNNINLSRPISNGNGQLAIGGY